MTIFGEYTVQDHFGYFYFCIRFLVGYGIVGVCTSTLGRMRGIKHDLNTVKKCSYKNWPYQNISDPIKVLNLELLTAHDHAVLQCRGHIGGGSGSRS